MLYLISSVTKEAVSYFKRKGVFIQDLNEDFTILLMKFCFVYIQQWQ